MLYVGLDVHARQSTFCVLDLNGRHLRTHAIRGRWDKVLAELAAMKRPFAVCFEATSGYGYLHEQLRKMAKRVVVAHPGQLRLIFRSKRKSDRVDAAKLAKLLFLDEVPPVYVPSAHVRAWRGMIEFRTKLVGERTRVKNRIRALLRTAGIVPPRGLWTKRGLAWLAGQTMGTDFDLVRRDVLIDELKSLDAKIKRVQKVLGAVGGQHPGVHLLMTIPGVGPRTAEAVVAYIDKPERFTRNKAVGSYFGLVPSQDASAEQNRLGHITRQGPGTVRRLLVEAAWQGIWRSEQIRTFFERIRQGNPERKKIAIVATAHYLLRAMHSMLLSGEAWQGPARERIVAGPSRPVVLESSR